MTMEGARAVTPHLDWHRYLSSSGPSGDPIAECRHASFLRGGRSRAGANPARRLEELSALAAHRHLCAVSLQGVRGRGLPHDGGAHRRAGTAAALAAGVARRGRGARIRDRAAVRGAKISAGGEAGGRSHGEAHPRCARTRTWIARLDDAGHARRRAAETRSHAAAHRLSGPVARLFGARHRSRPLCAQRDARECLRIVSGNSRRSANPSTAASGT